MARQRAGTLVYRRTQGWCARVWEGDARKWVMLNTHDRDLARRKMRRIVDGLEAGEFALTDAKTDAPETLAKYAATWLERREANKVVMAKDERNHLERFVLPDFGHLALSSHATVAKCSPAWLSKATRVRRSRRCAPPCIACSMRRGKRSSSAKTPSLASTYPTKRQRTEGHG
jgi:hypothetical protein